MDIYNTLQLGSVCSNPLKNKFGPRNWGYQGMQPIDYFLDGWHSFPQTVHKRVIEVPDIYIYIYILSAD